MRKPFSIVLISILVLVLAACNGGDKEEPTNHEEDELSFLEVDFEVPESATIGETVEIKATVTYGDKPVTDPEEVMFEIWAVEDEDEHGKENEDNDEHGHAEKDNSDKIDGTNNNDGTYTIEYTFDEVGDYEMYAHTTANDMHVMPKGKITITE